MRRENPYWWFVRILWPLLGGAWGAWLGFRGYFGISFNADTLAPIFVAGFYVFFTLIGLLAGAASAALIGGSVESLLRRFGAGIVASLSVATLINALALWQLGDFVQAKYPGLRADSDAKPRRSNATGAPTPADKGSYQKPCSAPPPTDTRERAHWDAECR